MFQPNQYQLLDFGDGRKLEKFGRYVVDRPCPSATNDRRTPDGWSRAAARYSRAKSGKGVWTVAEDLPESWTIQAGDIMFQLRLVESGQVGLFAEQVESWIFIRQAIRRARSSPRVLNAFAYTGGSTLAAAREGAEVVHLDASQSAVNWARQNAALSHLQNEKIRWIVDDARRFVEREIRRGNRYQALVLDPPSYGHGPRGKAWRIDEHLLPFLANCVKLLDDKPLFIVFTCHTTGMRPSDLKNLMHRAGFSQAAGEARARWMALRSIDGRHLEAGLSFFWSSEKMPSDDGTDV